MKYVHLDCLREWVMNRIKDAQVDFLGMCSVDIPWNCLVCELCKQRLPLVIFHEFDEMTKTFDLVEFSELFKGKDESFY